MTTLPDLKPEHRIVFDKISTKRVIREVSNHTKVPYHQTADVVYAFLHYVKYAAFMSDQRVVMRNFGSFHKHKLSAREYGRHVGAPTRRPDRIKLKLTTPVIEESRWKNTQSIQKTVANVLDVALKPSSMDLSVCVRIADLVLSNKPVSTLNPQERKVFTREWIHSVGAAPLLPSTIVKSVDDRNPCLSLKFRLAGREKRAIVFENNPTEHQTSLISRGVSDILFMPEFWISGVHFYPNVAEEIPYYPYGVTPEDNCAALFSAYKVAKYGDKKRRITNQEES